MTLSALSSKNYLARFPSSSSPSHYILHFLLNLLPFSWPNYPSLIQLSLHESLYVILMAFSDPFLLLLYFLKQHDFTVHTEQYHIVTLCKSTYFFVTTLYRDIRIHRKALKFYLNYGCGSLAFSL